MTEELTISAQVTPNPNTLKFVLNRSIIPGGSFDFPDEDAAEQSGLASELFEIDDIGGVFVGLNFVSVTKLDDSEWPDLVEGVIETIRGYINSGEPILDEELLEKAASAGDSRDDSEVATKIKQILDDEIRPAVAMDGGDIVFHSYQEGILTVQLQGACSGCPASTMTLKMGIENRLKEEIPEIREVIQLA